MRRITAVLLSTLVLVSCSDDDGSATSVAMTSGQTFNPEELTVSVGRAVTWTNESAESHTVTAYEDDLPDGADYFASGGASSEDSARDELADGLIDEGETIEISFDEPGTYRYFCIPHEEQGMLGTIVVEE